MGNTKDSKGPGAKGSTSQAAPDSRVKEIIEPGTALPKGNKIVPTPPANEEAKIKCGFLIGVSEDGKLKFNLIGKEPEINEILGLVRIAEEQILDIMDLEGNGKYTQLYAKLARIEGKLDTFISKLDSD